MLPKDKKVGSDFKEGFLQIPIIEKSMQHTFKGCIGIYWKKQLLLHRHRKQLW